MSQFLKQSTACTIMFGPFVDKTDGVTLEVGAGIITSIDHATTGIFLSKNGGTAAIRHQDVTASTLDAYGMFKVTLDTTDTNTVGTLDVLMAEAATFLPVHKSFMVLPANVYDSLMGTDLLDVSVTQLGGVAQSLTDLKDLADTGYDPSTHKVQGVVLTDTCTTNTDMRGTDGAALASAYTSTRAGYLDELAAANLPTDIAAIPTAGEIQTELEENGASILDTLRDDLADGGRLDLLVDAIKAKTDVISTDVVSANPAYMHNPIVDQDDIVVAQVGLIRNKPSAAAIQIAEITTAGLIKVWRYRKGTDAGWTVIVNGGGMGKAIGGVYYNYTFPAASWADGDLILYEVYNTVVTLGTEVFTLSTVQGFGVIGDTASVAAIKAVTDAESGVKAAVTALNDISVADIIAGIADGSYDLQEMLRIIFSACCLKSSGGGTNTITFRDSADAKNRISATVDASGNRTGVTLDGS